MKINQSYNPKKHDCGCNEKCAPKIAEFISLVGTSRIGFYDTRVGSASFLSSSG
jgi:hypothetical protein